MPSPRVSENVNRICTVGCNHFINLWSPLQNLSKTSAWLRKRSKTASGESQLSSWLANGCVRRSCLVSFLYSFEAASNMEMKFDKARFVRWSSEDMGIVELNRCEELRRGWGRSKVQYQVGRERGQIVAGPDDPVIILGIEYRRTPC